MSDFLDAIEACIPSLRRYARGLTHDRELADDLVQDCLERAIRKKSLFRPRGDGAVQPWLFKILLNLYRNQQQQRHRRPALVSMDKHEAAWPAPDNPQARFQLGETARAIQALPTEQRAALLLVTLEGLSYSEAAAILEVPQGTLMSRIARARQTLRQQLDDTHLNVRAVK